MDCLLGLLTSDYWPWIIRFTRLDYSYWTTDFGLLALDYTLGLLDLDHLENTALDYPPWTLA
jgi:hypothetical protein